MQWKHVNGKPVPILSAAERDARAVERHHVQVASPKVEREEDKQGPRKDGQVSR
jgi:hypothetical protein